MTNFERLSQERAAQRVECEKCGRSFSKLGIASHARRCGLDVDRIPCPTGCGREIARHRMAVHERVCQGAMSPAKCGTCGVAIPAHRIYCGRSCAAAGNAATRRDAPKVTCPQCGGLFASRGLATHMTHCQGTGTTGEIPTENFVPKERPVTTESLHAHASARRKDHMKDSVADARAASFASWRERRPGSK